ncbi:MAG TPA: PQQ-dependent sugar dehydrogenase [Solirubrobacterales bacterium]|nr:PQQ-dependent sugar dehydrogenase [Solirubrobacterales bacterium]
MLWALGVASAQAISLQPLGVFDQPTFVTSDPANPDRLFVVERRGAIKLAEDGGVGTFIDLSPVVNCCTGEQGLISMAPAPDFATTGRFYVNYTDNAGNIRVDELTATGDLADPLSRRSVLDIPHPGSDNHYGGQLQFGPDGYLYVSTGDGGGVNDPFHNAQDPDRQLGKILRIDPRPSGLSNYTVPPDNPFAGGPADDDTIWNLGLRNPFRFSFDRFSGGMAIGDVGQNAREEIDWAPSTAPGVVGGGGANYGWSCREGLLAGLGDDPACIGRTAADFTDPVFDYPHSDPGSGAAFGCSVIGGYVVRDSGLGSLYGRYVYTDFCAGDIRSLQLPATAGGAAGNDRSEGLKVSGPVSFGEDSCGRLYVLLLGGGIFRLTGLPTPGCPLPQATGPAGQRLHVGIKAERRRVRRGKPALIVAWISPCEGQRGKAVRLLRGGRPNGSKFLSRACTVRSHPRVRHRTMFTAQLVPSESDPLTAESRRLTIKIDHRRRR